jgi:hypothetical protein
VDAGAHDLGQVDAVEQDQRHQHRAELVGLDAGDAGQEEVGPEDHHQQRDAAHHEHERGDRPADGAHRADPRQAERDAQRQRQQQRQRGQPHGEREPAQRPVRILADQEVEPVGPDQVDHSVRTG